MAKKKKQELRDQSVADLVSLSRELEREVFALRNELSLHRKLEKPHLLKAKRKQKARVLTILTEKGKEGAVA